MGNPVQWCQTEPNSHETTMAMTNEGALILSAANPNTHRSKALPGIIARPNPTHSPKTIARPIAVNARSTVAGSASAIASTTGRSETYDLPKSNPDQATPASSTVTGTKSSQKSAYRMEWTVQAQFCADCRNDFLGFILPRQLTCRVWGHGK